MSAENSKLEQEFESEINKKNSHQKEVGQIINAINNIALISANLDVQKGKKEKNVTFLNEKSDKLFEELTKRLDEAADQIGDLIAVQEEMDKHALKMEKSKQELAKTTGGAN